MSARKTKIYLDTSVISHLDAPETPEKMEDTLRLWEEIKAGAYEVVLSEVVFDELDGCSDAKRDCLDLFLQKIQYERVESGNEAVALASKFVDFGILREKSFNDCRHIAAALLSGCEILVSWNFKHIVNARTIKGARDIAARGGYKDIMIYSPTMLVEGGDDE
ncbi:MAG: PIN domain-containing protein [Cystobacterineae bacterium]|nr:PIN domain-containing protein [Cystobacterineae bacterium]